MEKSFEKRRVFHIGKWLAAGMIVAMWGCKDRDAIDIHVTNDNLCSETAKVTCRNMFTCCPGIEIEDQLGVQISTTEEASLL